MKTKEERFANNPETGVNKLTAVGCMARFNVLRTAMELNEHENVTRSFSYPNIAEREEKRIQNKLTILFRMGYKLRGNESAEKFIARCEEVTDGSI